MIRVLFTIVSTGCLATASANELACPQGSPCSACELSIIADETRSPPGVLLVSKRRALVALPSSLETRCERAVVTVREPSNGLAFRLRFDASSDQLALLEEAGVGDDAVSVAWSQLQAYRFARSVLGHSVGRTVIADRALERLEPNYESLRVAARPFRATSSRRIGELPLAQGLQSVWWSGDSLCVRQGARPTVRCLEASSARWGAPEAEKGRPKRERRDLRFAGVFIREPGVSWSLEELGIDQSSWESRRMDADRRNDQQRKDELAFLDCSFRGGRLWQAGHTEADELRCSELESTPTGPPPIVDVRLAESGRAAVAVVKFDDAWELWLLQLEPRR